MAGKEGRSITLRCRMEAYAWRLWAVLVVRCCVLCVCCILFCCFAVCCLLFVLCVVCCVLCVVCACVCG